MTRYWMIGIVLCLTLSYRYLYKNGVLSRAVNDRSIVISQFLESAANQSNFLLHKGQKDGESEEVSLTRRSTPTAVLPSQLVSNETKEESLPIETVGDDSETNSTFVWDDDSIIHYDRLEKNCLDILSGIPGLRQNYIVYYVDRTVGFANQFRALSSIFLMAIATKRKLLIQWDDFFNITNTRFTQLRYTSEKTHGLKISQYTSFPRGFCNFTKYESQNIEQIFGRGHIGFLTMSDLSCLFLSNPEYQSVLSSVGFRFDPSNTLPDHPKSYLRELKRQAGRLLLRPSAEIVKVLHQNLKRFEGTAVVGIQIRTGGYVSNTAESKRFLYLSSLGNVISLARKVGNELTLEGKVCKKMYITADSNAAFSAIMNGLSDTYEIIQTRGFANGHSSSYLAPGKKHYTFLNRAVTDIILLSHCDYILYTRGSSFGRTAMLLSSGKPFIELRRD